MKSYNVAISIPNEGVTRPESYDNHLVVSFHLGRLEEQWRRENREIQYKFHWFTAGRLLTPMAREKLVKEALKAGMDYIIMYDDDMILPIDMFEKLLEDVEKNPEIDVLAPLAFMRNPPHFAVIYTATEGYDNVRHQEYFKNDFVKNYPRNKLVECDAVGFGAVLINLRILKDMDEPYFFSTTGTGEDIWFCFKAKKQGGRVFMDTRIKLGHLANPVIIDEEYVDKWNKKEKVKFEDKPHKYLSKTR